MCESFSDYLNGMLLKYDGEIKYLFLMLNLYKLNLNSENTIKTLNNYHNQLCINLLENLTTQSSCRVL